MQLSDAKQVSAQDSVTLGAAQARLNLQHEKRNPRTRFPEIGPNIRHTVTRPSIAGRNQQDASIPSISQDDGSISDNRPNPTAKYVSAILAWNNATATQVLKHLCRNDQQAEKPSSVNLSNAQSNNSVSQQHHRPSIAINGPRKSKYDRNSLAVRNGRRRFSSHLLKDELSNLRFNASVARHDSTTQSECEESPSQPVSDAVPDDPQPSCESLPLPPPAASESPRDYAELWRQAVERIIIMVRAARAVAKQNDVEGVHEPHGMSATAIGFSLDEFRRTNTKEVALSADALAALGRNPAVRTPADLRVLEKLADAFDIFAKYDPAVRRALARAFGYNKFGPDRTIIRQDHYGQNFYIIASGSVKVVTTNQAGESCVIAKLHAGASFGELAILQNTKRTASVITTTNTEFLWINKKDLLDVLHDESEKDIAEKQSIISNIPYFQQLSASAIKELAISAKFCEVPPNTPIFFEGDVPYHVFIICEGTCRLVKCVTFAEVNMYYHGSRRSIIPYPPHPHADVRYGYKPTHRLLNIGLCSGGDYFGEDSAIANVGTPHQIVHLGNFCDVGECSRFQFSLISKTRVRYMLLSRNTFAKEIISHPLLLNQAGTRAKALKNSLLNIPLVQDLYLKQLKWLNFKKQVVQEIMIAKHRDR
ncbi:hypothetical protein HDU84_004939 [Entophlyctis sp. JEL0112]|nr:hypothetical protein HDU84_004939 [Entophlyctis sp. JEL0112]